MSLVGGRYGNDTFGRGQRTEREREYPGVTQGRTTPRTADRIVSFTVYVDSLVLKLFLVSL